VRDQNKSKQIELQKAKHRTARDQKKTETLQSKEARRWKADRAPNNKTWARFRLSLRHRVIECIKGIKKEGIF